MNAPDPTVPRRTAATVLAALLLLAASFVVPAAAHAEAPLSSLDGEITDVSGVLGDDEAEVAEALDRLADETPYQLFVVYVDSFDGISGRDWANATANNASLGVNDLLLAVATTDRVYGLSVDTSITLSDERLDAVEAAAEDALRDDDWAGATVAAVDAVLGDSGSASDGGGSGSAAVLGVVVAGIVLVLLLVAGWLWFRARRRAGAADRPTVGRHGTAVPGEDALAALDTEELERRASAALVGIDDAIRTSDQELGFAQAEFGGEATRDFETALQRARTDATAAFRRRQELDDDGTDEQARRGLLLEILRRCERAAAALDEQTDAFDDLRDLHERAPELLEETAQRADEVAARIDVARQTVAGLATTYPASALASVRQNPDQAEALVAHARDAVATGRAALSQRTRTTAVGHLRAAQNALGQATTLLDAVETAGADLATAGADLDKGIASLGQDVADAARLGGADGLGVAVAPAVAEAGAAVEQARAARSGGDPLAALRRITAAEAALDAALAPVRQQAEADARANALLRDVLARVDARLRSTQDYVATRRGAVGTQARTRLTEAGRLLDEARREQPSDPAGALATAQRAESLADDAAQLARQDTSGWGMNQGGGSGSDAAGMVLGGILLDSVLRGSGGGIGGFGRGPRRGSGSPGSFGGGFGGGGFGGGGIGTGRGGRSRGGSFGNRGGRGGRSRGGRF